MKVKIVSDFHESYDHWFDSPYDSQIEFRRISNEGIDRPEMFILFEEYGLKIPAHGIVKDMFVDENHYRKSMKKVIVYLDNNSHCGENKIRLYHSEALLKFPNNYCSQYISADTKSLRYLRIGSRSFVLIYSSDDEWRSNCGDVNIEILGEVSNKGLIENKYPFEPYYLLCNMIPKMPPLFAIDFVVNKCGGLYAIDFNSAPSIKYTGIDSILSHKEIADLIIKEVNFRHMMGIRLKEAQELVDNVYK